jgi:ferric-dicitrate binding protein FerR (iron transport regulator)
MMISAGVLTAGTPLGTVISVGPITLDGKTVPPTAGSVPVVSGDVISTAAGAGAVLSLNDGSRVAIDANTSIQLKGENGSTVVHVRSGKVHLTKASGSNVRVETSKLKLGGKSKVPVIAGAAAAGATAAAIAVAESGSPAPRSNTCPPSNPQCQ